MYEEYDEKPIKVSIKLTSGGEVGNLKDVVAQMKDLKIGVGYYNEWTDLIMFNHRMDKDWKFEQIYENHITY